MIQYEIRPLRGAGPIDFGMSIERVREVVGVPFTTFLKTASSKLPTDAFNTLGFHVFYKFPGICEAIEFFAPSNPTLYGSSLIGQTFSGVRQLIESFAVDVVLDDCGLESRALGIGVFAPSGSEHPSECVEGVIVFSPDYYDT
jgi:hypothetical protein